MSEYSNNTYKYTPDFVLKRSDIKINKEKDMTTTDDLLRELITEVRKLQPKEVQAPEKKRGLMGKCLGAGFNFVKGRIILTAVLLGAGYFGLNTISMDSFIDPVEVVSYNPIENRLVVKNSDEEETYFLVDNKWVDSSYKAVNNSFLRAVKDTLDKGINQDTSFPKHYVVWK